MSQQHRLPRGGRVNRTQPLSMNFDGRMLEGFAGDTLASTMLANGEAIVARSFKYHRPRGIYAAGVEEPNALVHMRSGAWREPNTLATMVEAYEGLVATGQNAWPNVRYDAAAVNQAGGPLLAAGFYYKTFVGPRRGTKFWMFCERFIRKAAGMGQPPVVADPDTYEKVNGHCDVLVVGAGPAGLAAALAAGRAGARVILAEQDRDLGGSFLSERAGGESDETLRELVDELVHLDNVRVLKRTTVFGAYDFGVFGAIERVGDHLHAPELFQPRQRYWQIRAKRCVIATGALERPMVFGGNDRPGVMLADAVRCYLNRYAVLPSWNVVVATNNNSAYACAMDLARAGAVVTLVDTRSEVPEALAAQLRSADAEVLAGQAVVSVHGSRRVRGVEVVSVDGGGRAVVGKGRTIPCGLVAVSGGWSPVLHLWSQRGQTPRFDAGKACFLPEADPDSAMRCAGAAAGVGTYSEALATGFDAGAGAARDVGLGGPIGEAPQLVDRRDEPDWTREPGDVWVFTAANGKPAGKAFVDLQHDVTLSDIDLAHREGFVSVEHLKRYTTTGMAADQGKLSNVTALARMAALRKLEIQDVGTTRFRPPYTPVTIGAIAGHRTGEHFHATRLSPLHAWHERNGAAFIQAGAWLRAWYYPRPGESVREAYIREAAHVRAHAGLVDVSTLGKIAVQGPDAGEFLDRIYVNGFSSLQIGRLRYGVMLRDDGFVFDDGTVARLGVHDYFVTTTTANAGKVLSKMEFLLETAWRELRVTVTSVSDAWATAALAGPKSRDVLGAVLDGEVDVSNAALPPAYFIEAAIAGVPVRVHRMSYSGELAYEIFVPAKSAVAVWEAIMVAGTSFDLQPYGTEAMGALRVEKGHIAGSEIDGRTTLRDLGLEGLASKRKPYVGSVLQNRPLLLDPARPTLVGLEIEGDQGARAGMLLFGTNVATEGQADGHVTSTTYSPALGKNIALALLAHGPQRHGERIKVVDFLSDTTLMARVVAPHFYDPEGERQNG
jgi:methylglutamate dehydrogenase subunit C